MAKKIAIIILLFLVCGSVLYAQGENLTLKVAVIGPGNELYFWWGHIAIIIEDSYAGTSHFYDYGLFSFDNENFFYNFAFGRLLYSCGVSTTDRNYDIYRWTNRDIFIYTLDLPNETKVKVRDFAAVNILPENKDYYYHHFKDNCSTRIRDIIDIATDGQFMEKYGQETSRFTLRQHVRRHTWFFPPADWLLSFLMGQVIDTPITVWDDMFLPSEVGNLIEDFWYTDIYGERRKLVSSVETVFLSVGRPVVLDTPKTKWPATLTLSMLLSILFAFFFYLKSKDIKAGRVLAGVSMSICGFIFGTAALMLYFMNLFTNHDYTYQNANMIFCTPLLLVAFPVGILYAVTKNQKKLASYEKLLRIIWLLTAVGIVISMIIKLFPWFYQQNLTDQLLMLPISIIFTIQGKWRICERLRRLA